MAELCWPLLALIVIRTQPQRPLRSRRRRVVRKFKQERHSDLRVQIQRAVLSGKIQPQQDFPNMRIDSDIVPAG